MADTHWRNTMRPARFLMFDARAVFPFLLLLVHFRIYMVVLAVITTVFFWIVEQRGYTFDAALRWFRAFIVAPNRPAVLKPVLRRSMDYMEKPWFDEENTKTTAKKDLSKPAKSAVPPKRTKK